MKDPSGAVIAAASVVVTNEGTGLERRAATNDTGYYTVSSLPPGFYTISVEAAGFKHYVKTRNKLDPNMAATIDAELTVGAVSDTVEVVAAAAGVQTETATVGKLVESSQIQNMMLNGRNALYLALLKPGVRGGSLQTFDFGMTLGGLSVNGSRAQDNLFTYDGAIAIRTRGNNSSIGVPDIDTVQEIQILTANYNAEYGRAAGGQVRIVSRSGTRQFHGNAYEYFRNQALDANTWARNRAGQVRPANKFNQFGYNVNGPVYIPRAVEHRPQQTVLPVGPGVGPLPAGEHFHPDGAVGGHAAGRFLRVAQPRQPVFPPRARHQRSHHRPAAAR